MSMLSKPWQVCSQSAQATTTLIRSIPGRYRYLMDTLQESYRLVQKNPVEYFNNDRISPSGGDRKDSQ